MATNNLVPIILLRNNLNEFGGIGYFKVLASPDSVIDYDNEIGKSGGFYFNNTEKQRLGFISSTIGIDTKTNVDEIMILAPPIFVIVVSFDKKNYFETTDKKFYISDERFINHKFKSTGLYVINPNELEAKLIMNETLVKLRNLDIQTQITPFEHISNSTFMIDKTDLDFDYDNDLLQPNEIYKLISWTTKSDISLLAPILDYLNDGHINENSYIISMFLKSTYYKELDIPNEYYGYHNSELIDKYSNTLYRVIEPSDTSGVLIIGSELISLDLRKFLPIK